MLRGRRATRRPSPTGRGDRAPPLGHHHILGAAAGRRPDMPSNPPTIVTVELEEPLGDRVLLDGGVYPACSGLRGEEPVTPTSSTVVDLPPVTTGPTSTTVVADRPPTRRSGRRRGGHRPGLPHRVRRGDSPDPGALRRRRGRTGAARGREEGRGEVPQAAASISVTVHTVTFVDATHAAVNFELLYDDAMLLGPQDGEAVLIDGSWQVSRATRCHIIEQAGWRAHSPRLRCAGRDRLPAWRRPWSRCARPAAGRSSWCSRSGSSSAATATV